MGMHLTRVDLQEMKAVERNYAKHISIVDDIYSSEKELKQFQVGHEEDSCLCSAVKVLAASTGLDIEATRVCLWTMVQHWEWMHEILYSGLHVSLPYTETKMLYLKGL